MKIWALAFLVCGCAVPKQHNPTHLMLVPSSSLDRVIPWKYPANQTNYWWDMQKSSNLTDWITVMTNTGPEDITVTNNHPRMFFRMKGRP